MDAGHYVCAGDALVEADAVGLNRLPRIQGGLPGTAWGYRTARHQAVESRGGCPGYRPTCGSGTSKLAWLAVKVAKQAANPAWLGLRLHMDWR